MMEEKQIGSVGGDDDSIDVVINRSGDIELRQDNDCIILNVTDYAVHLAVLLDKAVGLAKGGVELDKDVD